MGLLKCSRCRLVDIEGVPVLKKTHSKIGEGVVVKENVMQSNLKARKIGVLMKRSVP